jgi:hypothetical protein
MKNVITYSLVLLGIIACGSDFNGSEYDPDTGTIGSAQAAKEWKMKSEKAEKAKIEDEDYGNTTLRVSCSKTTLYTTFKYVGIMYPNGDADVLCAIRSEGKWEKTIREYYGSGNRFAENAVCVIENAWNNYWKFYMKKQVKAFWWGEDTPLDATTGGELERNFGFSKCTVEWIEDENWWNSRYPFNEHLI